MKAAILLLSLFLTYCLKAQLIVSAGRDTTVCAGSLLALGGSATATGGTLPYTYNWLPATGLSCNTCANPVITVNSNNTYTVKVTDAIGDSGLATIHVQVNLPPLINITANSTNICSGQQVYLHASANAAGCGEIVSMCNASTSAQIGTGTTLQPGNGVTYPSILGNLRESCRQQMVYTTSELFQALGGPTTISGIAFDVGEYNSNAYLLNFVIKIGCSPADSLATWNESLLTLLPATSIQPQNGWNDFALTNGYYWDGVSNLVIELCFYNNGLYGNQSNKAVCTVTPKNTYIYSAANYNQCDTTTIPIASNLRPNVKFSYCNNPVSAYTYHWGPDSVNSPLSASTYAYPYSTNTYQINVTGQNGCTGKDSITINVRPNSISAGVHTIKATCGNQLNGSIQAVIYGAGAMRYQLTDSNYTSVLDSGTGTNNDTVAFAGLMSGAYHLLLTDSFCANIDYPITIGQKGSVHAHINTSLPTCPLMNDGVIHATLSADEYPLDYTLYTINFPIDSGTAEDSSQINIGALRPATYTLIITDSLCADTQLITINPPLMPALNTYNFNGSCYGDSTGSGCVLIMAGTQPYTYVWSDPLLTGSCPSNMAPGNYSVTVSDASNCSVVISNIVIQQLAPLTVTETANQPTPSSDFITIYIRLGFSPYSVNWGDNNVTTEYTTSASHQYFSAGSNIISVTDNNGCTGYDTVISILSVGITQNYLSNLKIYPNPATDHLFIESNEAGLDDIEILDVTGTEVKHLTLKNPLFTDLNISDLSTGVYVINAISNGQVYRSRFVKGQ